MHDESCETSVNGDTLIVRCKGRLIGDQAVEVRSRVKPLLAGARHITLDLTDVVYMDSIGLGVIASLYVSSRSAGRRFEVVNISPRIRDLFSATHLLPLFESSGERNLRTP
jgi:anti-sigma B factor antagonist